MKGSALLITAIILSGSAGLCFTQDTTNPKLEMARQKEEAYQRTQKAWRIHGQDRLAEEIDVRRYDLDLEIFPETEQIGGSVHLRADFVAPAETLWLNMNSSWLHTDSIIGPVVGHSHSSHKIALFLERQYQTGESIDITVFYHGSPDYSSFGVPFFYDYDGYLLITTLSQPFGARNWWPCKDQPDDKADSVSISVVVPSPLVVASNGSLLSTEELPGERTRYNWVESYPIVTYLVSLAIAEYELVIDWFVSGDGDSMPVFNYVPEADWASEFDVTVPALEVYSQIYGPYPFQDEKYGHALFPWGGGMEHQTCTSIGWFPDYDGWEDILVHELAHQWWGDMITCQSFHHIWLNEGFATYSEALWHEEIGGESAYHNKISGDRYFGGGTVFVEDPENDNIFDYGLSYQKASYILHMLRHVVGNRYFFMALQHYRQQYEYSTSTTDGFRESVEELGWGDLDWFFEQWIYTSYYPKYEYGWLCTEIGGAGWTTTIVIRQVQTNTGLFRMPLDIILEKEDGESEKHVVWSESLLDSMTFETDSQVVGIDLDPDDWVLCRKTEVSLSAIDLPFVVEAPSLTGPWPNPTVSSARLSVNSRLESRLSIYDLTGRRIFVEKLAPGGGQIALRLDGDEISTGVYIVRLENSQGKAERRLVVRR